MAKAFKEKGKLTSAEIGTILGCLGPQAVSRVRRSGIILNVVGKIKTPGRKSRVLYSVANETRVFTT